MNGDKLKKATRVVASQASVYNNDEYESVINVVKQLQPEYINGDKSIKRKVMSVIGNISKKIQDLKQLKETTLEASSDDLITDGITSQNDDVLSRVLEGNYKLGINIDEDFNLDFKINTPEWAGGIDDVAEVVEGNMKGNKPNIIADELQLLKTKAEDGDPWTSMLQDEIKANIESNIWDDNNFRTLLYDPTIGTQRFVDHFVKGSQDLSMDINGDGVLEDWEKRKVFDQYVDQAEAGDKEALNYLKNEFTDKFLVPFYTRAFKQSAKENNDISNFDANSYKKV